MNKTYEIISKDSIIDLETNYTPKIEPGNYSQIDLNNNQNSHNFYYSNNDIYDSNFINYNNISTKTTPNFYNKPKIKKNNSYIEGNINLLKREGEEFLDNLDKSMNDIIINRSNINMDKIIDISNQNNSNNNESVNKAKYFLLNANDENDIKYEIENLQSKYITLSNDNIMLKEDIYRLTDINKNLEREIDNQRKHNLSLAEENDNINKQNIDLNNKINNTNNQINLIRNNLNKYKKADIMRDKIYYKDLQMKQDYDYKKLNENKCNLEVDYRLLKEKYSLLEEKNNEISKKLNLLKKLQDNKLNELETKITEVLKVINNLKNENIEIQKENNLLNDKLLEIENEKNNYCKIYSKQKTLNNNLKKKIEDIKEDFNEYKKESIIAKKENNDKKRAKKEKHNLKKEIISDLQKRINNYKEMQNKYRNID